MKTFRPHTTHIETHSDLRQHTSLFDQVICFTVIKFFPPLTEKTNCVAPPCRYKDGEIIPLEEWQDVSVSIKKEDNKVVSSLKIRHLSHHKSVLIFCSFYVICKNCNVQTRPLQLRTWWTAPSECDPVRHWWWDLRLVVFPPPSSLYLLLTWIAEKLPFIYQAFYTEHFYLEQTPFRRRQ